MAISMAKTIKEERLRWVFPIVRGEMRLVDVAKVCPHSKRSLERWVAVYKRGGEKALEPKATIPKTSPEETPIWIKERVITKRKKTNKNPRDLERKIRVWNTYYNNLEHCGLGGKTPNEFLKDYKLIKPPNVLA